MFSVDWEQASANTERLNYYSAVKVESAWIYPTKVIIKVPTSELFWDVQLNVIEVGSKLINEVNCPFFSGYTDIE